jgi:crotonobetaine/carnitine-CoA ligase
MTRTEEWNDPAAWVLPAVLAEQARRRPDEPWFIGIDSHGRDYERVSFGRMHEEVLRVAGHLQSLGIARGDRVVIFAGNHADFVRAWLGVQMLGAVSVLLNTELRGAFLAHQLNNAGAAWAITDAALATVLAEASEPSEGAPLRQVLTLGDDTAALPFSRWREAEPYAGPLPQAQDIACVMYTSGTSGPAKGVLMPHAHCTLYGLGAIEALQITASDRYYIVLPLFHSNGLFMQLGATLLAGIPALVRPRFSASEWLNDIREHRATLTSTLGVLASFIAAQPASRRDQKHQLRALCNAPNVPQLEQVMRERFGIGSVVSGYGMTEVNIPVWGRVGQSTPGSAGWATR